VGSKKMHKRIGESSWVQGRKVNQKKRANRGSNPGRKMDRYQSVTGIGNRGKGKGGGGTRRSEQVLVLETG